MSAAVTLAVIVHCPFPDTAVFQVPDALPGQVSERSRLASAR